MSQASMLLCAVLFLAPQPVPAQIESHYRQAYECPPTVPAPRQPRAEPIARVHHYFPAPARHWPLLAWNFSDLDAWMGKLSALGVRPGLLLPPMNTTLAADELLLQRLRDATHQGALPVATLPSADPLLQKQTLMFWCSLRLCPRAWYLPQGGSTSVALLLPGDYLCAPHWQGHPQLPLPARALSLSGRRLRPLYAQNPPPGASAAVMMPLAGLRPHSMPPLPYSWRWMGWKLSVTADGLQAPAVVRGLLWLRGSALRLWAEWFSWRVNLLAPASNAFAWFAVAMILANLCLFGVLALRGGAQRMKRA